MTRADGYGEEEKHIPDEQDQEESVANVEEKSCIKREATPCAQAQEHTIV